MFVLDGTGSMGSSDGNCTVPGKTNPTRFQCALYSIQSTLKVMPTSMDKAGLTVSQYRRRFQIDDRLDGRGRGLRGRFGGSGEKPGRDEERGADARLLVQLPRDGRLDRFAG